jgi:hypothetical protein
MMNRESGGPTPEEMGVESEKPSTRVEEIRLIRSRLEKRADELQRNKQDNLEKQMKERGGLIVEDAELVPQLQEAKSTLEYFETQGEFSTSNDSEYTAELGKLRDLVTSLEEQRDEALRKYESIMRDPDVYGKVWEEAHEEKKTREIKEKTLEEARELFGRAKELADKITELASSIDSTNTEGRNTRYRYHEAAGELNKVIDEARNKLQHKHYQTVRFLDNLANQVISPRTADIVSNTKKVDDYRQQLGIFQGREKAAVDHVLKSHTLREIDNARSADSLQQAKYDELNNTQAHLAQEYRQLTADALEKAEELGGEGISKHDLASDLHHKIETHLYINSGVWTQTDGKSEEVYSRHNGSVEAAKAYQSLDSFRTVFDKISDFSNRSQLQRFSKGPDDVPRKAAIKYR